MHWYLKIPRFDGRKTLAFNGLVFVAASGWLTAAYTGLTGFGPVGETGLHALAAVAALNGLLRLVTERPVWWRQMQWSGWDLGSGESETVYHKAAAFAEPTLADMAEHEAARRIMPYAAFKDELDKRLIDTREAFDGQFYGNGPHVLPLDVDGERH